MSIVDKYSFRVVWSDEDSEYVGLCLEFPSLSWLAETRSAALAGVERVVADAVADMADHGEDPPAPLVERAYSGDIRVRVPPGLHKRLALEAREAGSSLNRHIINKLTSCG